MEMHCLRHFFGLFGKRDYVLPQVVRVEPLSLSVEHNSAVLTARYYAHDKLRTFLLLKADNGVRAVRAFDTALQSLSDFVHAKQPMFIKFVQNRDLTRCVLTDVEHFGGARRHTGNDSAASDTTDDEEEYSRATAAKQLLRTERLVRDNDCCYFMFTREEGPITWIAALRTGERGNRFPFDERNYSVVRFATLERMLKSSASVW